jgi:hypothetical protein
MRHYKGDWPVLEAALFEWQQRMQNKKATITGDILKAKAAEIWGKLPQYSDVPMPKWSNGWLEGFKKRFRIKEYVQHGEAATADIFNPLMIEQMNRVRDLCKQYRDKDIFNMDETGLFWKLQPDRTLATEAQSGGKKSKDRVTLAFTTNADGSEKMQFWMIGKSKKPRCLKNVNIKLLRMHYRNNKSKWMTGIIMAEFLRWFDRQMRGRKVLLLLDNFSGHELGVQLVGGLEGLTNVRVTWLPANTTSYWQPLDQGIILIFKLAYRKLWILYMLRQFEANKNPNKTVTLLKAIQWTRVAWDSVTADKIQRSFWKSTVIPKPLTDEQEAAREAEELAELADFERSIAALPISNTNRMSAAEFLNPVEEVVEDTDGDILASVVEIYSAEKEGEEESEEEGDVELSKVSIAEAVEALETLQLYSLQVPGDDTTSVQALDRLGREIRQHRRQGEIQSSISRYFTLGES